MKSITKKKKYKIRKLKTQKLKTKKNKLNQYSQKGGGLLKKFFPFCFPSGKKVETLTRQDILANIKTDFNRKFDARINYFADTLDYHPTIQGDKDELQEFFESSSTLQTMLDINERIKSKKTPKIVHTILLHGTMKKEAMRH